MAILTITGETTVGQFNNAIKALEEAKNANKNTEFQERLQHFIDKYTTSKNKLITICKNDIVKGNLLVDPETRIEVKKVISDNYKNLSLHTWNKVIAKHNERTHDKAVKKHGNKLDLGGSIKEVEGQPVIDFLEGKSGINLMTGVKASLAAAAVSSLCSLNIGAFAGLWGLSLPANVPASLSLFSFVPEIITGLATLNPVLGVAAGALLGIGAIALVKKIFGPEIKKMWSNFKVNNAVKKATKKAENSLESTGSDDFAKSALEEITELEKVKPSTGDRSHYSLLFEQKVKEIAHGDGIDMDKKIADLKTEYAGKVSDMEEILKKLGVSEKQPDLGDIASDLVKIGKFKEKGDKNSKSRKDFNHFRAEYNKLVIAIADKSLSESEQSKIIRDLRKFANDDSNFVDKAGGQGNSTTDVEARRKKVQSLCQGMVDILSDLQYQANKTMTPEAIKKLKTDLEGQHGLTADQIEKL